MQSSGGRCRENAKSCLSTVIARSEATKQSRVAWVALDCFAYARNDEVRCMTFESKCLRVVVPA